MLPDIVVRVDRVPEHVIGDLYGHKLSKIKARQVGFACVDMERSIGHICIATISGSQYPQDTSKEEPVPSAGPNDEEAAASAPKASTSSKDKDKDKDKDASAPEYYRVAVRVSQ